MQTYSRKVLILITLLIATILSPLDFYIVNLALAPIQRGLNTTAGQLQMIVSFYTCAYAIFQITGGRLGDLIGRKQMFMTGLAGFVIASTICGLATSATMMILGRLMQGVAGAIMAPQVLAIIHVTFTEKEKTKVMALYSFTFGLAAVLGQYLGGLLMSCNIFNLGWRVVFLINIPIGLVAWIGAFIFLPNLRSHTTERIDALGIILLSLALGFIVYPLTLIVERGMDISIITMLLSSVILMILFVIHQKKMVAEGRNPLIDISVFKYHNLSIGSFVAFLFYSSGIFYLAIGIYLQEDRHWSALNAGTAIIPFGVGFLLSSLSSPKIVRWVSDTILTLGILIKASGFILIIYSISLAQAISYLFYMGLLLGGCGMGLTLSSIVRISLYNIPNKYAGLASGVINCALQIGSAIGVAGIGSIFFYLSKENGYAYGFQISLSIVVFLLFIASLTTLFIKKKK